MLDHCLLYSTMTTKWDEITVTYQTDRMAHENDVFDFAKEIHEYCKADVQLLKSGCIKFRNAFITDIGIDQFQSCTIAGACMHVLRTSHLKPNSIGRVPVNGYSSLRNYSNKSMEWITYCENITGVSYRHA